MDDVDIEIDVDDCDTSVGDHFQVNSKSRQTFNVLVNGPQKYEELDPFLIQGDVRSVLELGYDPFQSDRSLPDDPHIMESTLDSILGVNEEEEVVGQGVLDNEEELDHGFLKSNIERNIEIENKDVKKYNTRQRRKLNNDSMFIYESTGSAKPSSNKADKYKKKQDPTSTRGRGRPRTKVSSDGFESADDLNDVDKSIDKFDNERPNQNKSIDKVDNERPNQNKSIDKVDNETPNQNKSVDKVDNETPNQNKLFDDRRLTRRQALLKGIKPVVTIRPKKNKKLNVEVIEIVKIECSDDDNDDNDSNISQDKLVVTREDMKMNTGRSKHINKHEDDESNECNDDFICDNEYESDDDDDSDGDDDDDDDSGSDDDDKDYTEVDSKKIYIKSSCDDVDIPKRHGRQKKDDDDEAWETHEDLKSNNQCEDENVTSTNKSSLQSKMCDHDSSLWGRVSGSVEEVNSTKSEFESAKVKTTIGKTDKPVENIIKEKKIASNIERKIKESFLVKKTDSEKGQDVEAGIKTKTISLESFVQNSMRKGGKTCKGPGCEVPLMFSQKSIFCSLNCIDRYSQYVLQILVKERMRTGQTSGAHGDDRLVVLERQTGKILTGPAAPTETTLMAWLTRHPSFEVMLSSQPADERRDKKIPVEKKPLPAYLRDNPGLTKDIQTMATKLLNQKKDADDMKLQMGSSSSSSSQPSASTSNQSKRPDPTRMSVRNVLREALTARANGSEDVMVSTNEIKSLVMDIEDELCKACDGVTTKYKYKIKAIVTQIKDLSNKGFFKRLLYGELQPNQLVRMTNERIASAELASWSEDTASLGILVSGTTTKPPYDNQSSKSPPFQPIFDIVSSATSETTSQHGTHFFDMNCKICTGKVPEPSYNPSSKSEANFGYYAKSITQSSPISSYPLSPIHSKKAPLLPTPSLLSKDIITSENPSLTQPSSSNDNDDVLWMGTIYAKEITSVRLNTYLLSGSLSSPTSGSVKSALYEDLPETVHMTGRLSPDNLFSIVNQLKSSGRLSKDVVMVYFLPATPSENSFYQSLFSYLSTRNRCGIISTGTKKDVGRIKDFYILALPANTPPPSALLPFEGLGLPTTRGDLILGVMIKHTAPTNKPPQTNSWKLTSVDVPLYKIQESPSMRDDIEEDDDDEEDDDEDDDDVENKVIFNSFKSDYTKDSKGTKTSVKPVEQSPSLTVKPVEQSPSLADNEPYEPFENPVLYKVFNTSAASNASAQTSAKQNADTMTVVKSGPSRVNVITPSKMNMSILASENIAATLVNTLSAVTNSTSLKEQQKMLQELTQKINEQKIILQQQEQSFIKSPESPQQLNVKSTTAMISTTQNSITPSFPIYSATTIHYTSAIHNEPVKLVASTSCPTDILNSPTVISAHSDKPHLEDKKIGIQKMSTLVKPGSSLPVISKPHPASVPNISGNIMSSLPASINQLLSGESFKNLKDIMANMHSGKQQPQLRMPLPKVESSKPFPALQEAKLPSHNISTGVSVGSKDSNDKDNKDPNKSTNVHGDVDYRLEPGKSQQETNVMTEKEIYLQFPPPSFLVMNKTNNPAQSTTTNNMAIKQPLLITPLQSPSPVISQNKSSNDTRITTHFKELSDPNLYLSTRKTDKKKEVTVWKPLLSREEPSNHGRSKEHSRRDGSDSSYKRRLDRKDISRSRDRKRKRSSDNSQKSKKINDKSNYVSKKITSDDEIQIIKEEKIINVINIVDEEVDMVEDKSSKTESHGDSKERPRNRSKEGSASRSQQGRRDKRSRSPRNRLHSRNLRRSRSRSPMKRQITSKIDPQNLPHGLPSLFPSLMQIVGGTGVSKKTEAECTVKAGIIPSLLDMMDPNILPERYRKIDGSGLLGSYDDDNLNFGSAVKSKKGLLGDFPSQLSIENKASKDVEVIKDKNLETIRKESQQQSTGNTFTKVLNERDHVHKLSSFSNTKDISYNPEMKETNYTNEDRNLNPIERTLLPTPKSGEPRSKNFPPYPPPHPELWNYPRRGVFPKGDPPFPLNFYRPGNMRPPMSAPPLMMPRLRNDIRPFFRFPQDFRMASQGHIHRTPFGSPPRYAKRLPKY